MPKNESSDDVRLVESVRRTQVCIWQYLLEQVSEPIRSLLYSYQALGVLDRILSGSRPDETVVNIAEVRAGIYHTMEDTIRVLSA